MGRLWSSCSRRLSLITGQGLLSRGSFGVLGPQMQESTGGQGSAFDRPFWPTGPLCLVLFHRGWRFHRALFRSEAFIKKALKRNVNLCALLEVRPLGTEIWCCSLRWCSVDLWQSWGRRASIHWPCNQAGDETIHPHCWLLGQEEPTREHPRCRLMPSAARSCLSIRLKGPTASKCRQERHCS